MNAVGEGSQGWNGLVWLDHFSVMQVSKMGGHVDNVHYVVVTVGIGP